MMEESTTASSMGNTPSTNRSMETTTPSAPSATAAPSAALPSQHPPSVVPGLPAGTENVAATSGVSKRKNKSPCWEHFTVLLNPDGSKPAKPRAKCNHCPQTYFCHTKGNGTTSMNCHMLYQCKKCPLYIPAKKQKNLVFESGTEGGNLVARAYDEDTSRLALARMIIRDELPFSFVEGDGFRDFMGSVQPLFKKISRRTVTKDIWDLYQMEKTRIKNILATYGQRVSLTTDTWTSIQNINYMVLTAHFIDNDWVLHKRILNFCVIPNHRGKTIGQLVETCLIGWGIEKVFTIVVDNASPNQVALDYMKEKIGNWDQLVLDGKFLHLRCCCHILNLIVKDGMDDLEGSIDAIRNAVKYIRSSPSRLEKFRKCAAQEKVDHKGGIVPLDVCTRWNNTYFMLEIALKYRKAFVRMEDEDPDFELYFSDRVGGKKKSGPPRSDDWETAARLVKFLKTFYDATLMFSGTSKVTANQPLIWMSTIIGELEKCEKGGDALMVAIASSMRAKFDKYWGRVSEMNKILFLAVVLDPRYKLLYLEYFFPKLHKDKQICKDMLADVKILLMQLYYEYSEADPEAAQASYVAIQPRTSNSTPNLDDSHAANMQEFIKLRQAQDVVEIKNEVDKYLLDASEDPSNLSFCVCSFWKENGVKYPVLSQISRDIFGVPASTVASESAFSLGKRILDPFRSSLTPRMVEALVCTSDWFRNEDKPLFKEPYGEEMELYAEMEKLETESGVTNAALDMMEANIN